MLEPTTSRWIKGIEYKSMTVLLADFRKTLERESGESINQLETNAALILSDLCTFLGLSDENRRKVLGVKGAYFVDTTMDTPINRMVKQ
jgi:hypothetical protein